MAFPFHPQTREHYSDEVRGLFPETLVIDPHVSPGLPTEDGGVTPWESVPELSRSQRAWIIKSGRSGGSGRVFSLDCERKGAQAMIDTALKEREEGIFWVAQRRVSSKLDVPVFGDGGETLHEKMHSRTTPVYHIRESGDCELLGGCVVVRRHWKVHGQPDAGIHGIIVKD
jgi:hypothetical protein